MTGHLEHAVANLRKDKGLSANIEKKQAMKEFTKWSLCKNR